MEREYLAKFKSRRTERTISYYRAYGNIYEETKTGPTSVICLADSVPSRIMGYEEMRLKDGF